MNHRDRPIGDDTEKGDVFPSSFASPSGKGNGHLIGCRADAGRRNAVYLDVRVSIANHVKEIPKRNKKSNVPTMGDEQVLDEPLLPEVGLVPQPFGVGDSREQAVREFGRLREGALIVKGEPLRSKREGI